jgi:glycosyltransferase involved in cell wall biosynthesis
MTLNASLDANYSSARALREIIESSNFSDDKDLTVFIGVYNAESFLDSMLQQILNQDTSNCSLLVVDNASSDNTWERLQPWMDKLPIRLVRNHKNHGATGSLYLNVDLVVSPWLTFMHQDDEYLPHHLSTMTTAISSLAPEVVTISTDMGSMDLDGAKFPSPPRAAWMLPDDSLETNFLANLRLQSVPWPSTSFRTGVLLEVASPWHSSSFQDTEMMLHIAMLGKSIYLPTQTMLYRENPDSGSHELNLVEKQIGAGLALLRVFASDRFRFFLTKVPKGDRKFFARSTISGIAARLGESEICQYVQLQAAEVMIFTWGYDDEELNDLVAYAYEQMGAVRTVEFLTSLNGSESNACREELAAGRYAFKPRFAQVWRAETARSASWESFGVKVLSRFPLAVKRFLFRKISVYLTNGDPSHPWNYKWR